VDTYSLYDLNEYVKRVIALNFPEPIWISCEVAQCKGARGHYYLDLIEQNDKDEVIAQSSAVIWAKSLYFLKAKLGDLLPSLLQEGVQIKVKVNIEFNERYGMKLLIEDIDPTYTLGQMELNRQKILERLKKEEVTEQNKALSLPRVIQRLAVISSETAAGYIDFKTHMSANAYCYHFAIDLFTAAMQGANTDNDVVDAVRAIKAQKEKYDAIVLIRGGGSKLDLAAFDSFNIGYAIATSPLPFITGIGHEIDQSVADLMSHTSMKTPTAVADFIIDHNATYEASINDIVNVIGSMSGMAMKNAHISIANIATYIRTTGFEKIKYHKLLIDQQWYDTVKLNTSIVKEQFSTLQSMDMSIKLSNPDKIMKRGFALVKKDGIYLTSSHQLTQHDNVSLTFFDGSKDAVVK
jgi:exodeoxyribonuclease VII large subunit